MNVLHMKYAVEVARLGSLNRAAETLFVAQPNISRSIKELEADLGITIFTRTAKGMVLTPEGADFIGYAEGILRQIDGLSEMYKEGAKQKAKFSLSAPRASYISEAFAEFSSTVCEGSAELFYKETNSQRTIKNLTDDSYNLGIVRYADNFDKYFKEMLEERGFVYEMVAEFQYSLLMSKSSPLASIDNISYSDTAPYMEIAHADPYVPSLPLSKVVKEELPNNTDRRIFIFERASQFDILSENPDTFMWVSPIPQKTLERYGLVMKKCAENKRVYKDVLIYKEGYKLSRLDKDFITALCASRRRNFS